MNRKGISDTVLDEDLRVESSRKGRGRRDVPLRSSKVVTVREGPDTPDGRSTHPTRIDRIDRPRRASVILELTVKKLIRRPRVRLSIREVRQVRSVCPEEN